MLLLFFLFFFGVQMLHDDKSALVCLLYSCLGSVKMIEYMTLCFANFRKCSDSFPITYCFWPIISLQCSRGSKPFFFPTVLFTLSLQFPNFNSLCFTLCLAVVDFLCDSFLYGIAFNSVSGVEKMQKMTSYPPRTG